jgi:GWxTD domain-containing protein
MNYRILSLISFIFLISSLGAIGAESDFVVNFEHYRSFKPTGNTVFETAYSITYDQLNFSRKEYGFQADIKTEKFLFVKDKWVSLEQFTEHVVTKNEVWTKSDEKSYKDIVEVELSKGSYRFKLVVTDLNSDNFAEFETDLNVFTNEDAISDLELNSSVEKVLNKENYLPRFQRGGYLFDRAFGHLVKSSEKSIFITFNRNPVKNDAMFSYQVQVEFSDDVLWEKKLAAEDINGFELIELPLNDLKEGAYSIKLSVLEKGNIIQSRENYFFIKEEKLNRPYLFTDIDDEVEVIKYMVNLRERKRIDNLSKDAKEGYLAKFWAVNNPDPSSENNQFFYDVKSRIDYANKFFTHFKKGWKSDRGRILIKNGMPDQTQDFDMSDVIGDFKIWKYDHLNCVYLFYDINTSGTFKLYYASNDEIDTGNHTWKSMIGDVTSIDGLIERLEEIGSEITRY